MRVRNGMEYEKEKKDVKADAKRRRQIKRLREFEKHEGSRIRNCERKRNFSVLGKKS